MNPPNFKILKIKCCFSCRYSYKRDDYDQCEKLGHKIRVCYNNICDDYDEFMEV